MLQYISRKPLTEVRLTRCKPVLNRIEKTYAGETIRQAYIAMGAMLKSTLKKLENP